jgi:hypothetical protein
MSKNVRSQSPQQLSVVLLVFVGFLVEFMDSTSLSKIWRFVDVNKISLPLRVRKTMIYSFFIFLRDYA